MTSRLGIVTLISGRGTNLRAIIDAIADRTLPVDLRAVICNRPDAPGIELARRAGCEVTITDHRDFPSRERFDAALAEAIDGFDPELVVLAGFMRILTPGFVRRYAGRLINIHPSLLPEFPGLDTHARAIAAGRRGPRCDGPLRDRSARRRPDHRPGPGSGPRQRRSGHPCGESAGTRTRPPAAARSCGSPNGGSSWWGTASSSTASRP